MASGRGFFGLCGISTLFNFANKDKTANVASIESEKFAIVSGNITALSGIWRKNADRDGVECWVRLALLLAYIVILLRKEVNNNNFYDK